MSTIGALMCTMATQHVQAQRLELGLGLELSSAPEPWPWFTSLAIHHIGGVHVDPNAYPMLRYRQAVMFQNGQGCWCWPDHGWVERWVR